MTTIEVTEGQREFIEEYLFRGDEDSDRLKLQEVLLDGRVLEGHPSMDAIVNKKQFKVVIPSWIEPSSLPYFGQVIIKVDQKPEYDGHQCGSLFGVYKVDSLEGNILTVTEPVFFFAITGYYSSWDSTSWDDEIWAVTPFIRPVLDWQ